MLLVVTPESAYPLQLGTGTTRLPSGAEVLVEGDRLQLQAGRAGVTVNDVEVHGSTALHPGDVLGDAELNYLVLPGPASIGKEAPLLDHWVWQRRLEEEVAAGESPFSILLGRSGAFGPEFLASALTEFSPLPGVRHIAGSFGRNGLEVLVLGDNASVERLRQFVSDRAARQEETVRWGSSSFPRHGATGEELWSIAVERLLGMDTLEPPELVWSDPCMTRLRAFSDHWTRRALGLIGGEGVGRESFARLVRLSGTRAAPFVVHRAVRFDKARWEEDVARAAGGSLHLRRPEILPEQERRAFWLARSFRPSASVAPADDISLLPENRIVIPELVSRPADVAPISELAVHSVDAQLGRRRSSLRAETRSLLQRLPLRENVRTLRNVVIRGALNATGAELRPEHLEFPWAAPAFSGVRAKVRETERREIEAALHRSGWNVTEAARRMELPRRTLVYRMARLGLRRPGSSA